MKIAILAALITVSQAQPFEIPLSLTIPDGLTKREVAQSLLAANNSISPFGFAGQIAVGTPPQNFKVRIDTSSTDFWVRSSACTDASYCTGRSAFNSSLSSSFNFTANATGYGQVVNITSVGGVTVQGPVVMDKVSIGSVSTGKDYQWVLADAIADMNPDDTYDGSIGLARGYPGLERITFFEALMKQGNTGNGTVGANVFSYYIDQSDEKGQLIIGGIDANRLTSRIGWFPLSHKSPQNVSQALWKFDLQSVSVPSKNVTIKVTNPAPCLVHTGAPLGFLNTSIASSFHKQISSSFSPQASGGVIFYVVDCTAKSKLPSITLDLDGRSLFLTPEQYVFTIDEEQGVCISSFLGQNFGSKYNCIIGNGILKNFYTVFDQGENRIGFASIRRDAVGSLATNLTSTLETNSTVLSPVKTLSGTDPDVPKSNSSSTLPGTSAAGSRPMPAWAITLVVVVATLSMI